MKDFLIKLAAIDIEAGSGSGQVNIPTISAEQVVQNALNIMYMLMGIIAVIVIIVAGIMYSTSGGDSGRVSKAKNMILYAVIGIVVIIAAFAITNFVIGAF